MTDLTLFELDDQAEDVEDELRADDSASACCRFCQLLSTAAGIDRHDHGPESSTCARWRAVIAAGAR